MVVGSSPVRGKPIALPNWEMAMQNVKGGILMRGGQKLRRKNAEAEKCRGGQMQRRINAEADKCRGGQMERGGNQFLSL